MPAIFSRTVRPLCLSITALMVLLGAATLGAQQPAAPPQGPQQQSAPQNPQEGRPAGAPRDDSSITHSRGQSIIPIYNGWHPNTDGSFDLWFGYLSDNWNQEVDLPAGANNNISAPYGPDAGQPTHFFPRNNRFQFKITVPKDFGKNEIVWTLTTAGRTYRAYATLDPSYVRDDFGMSREYWGEPPPEGNTAPELTLEGPKTRRLKVGEYAEIVYTVKDDGRSERGRDAGGAAGGGAAQAARAARNAAASRGRNRASICGEANNPFFCGEPNESAGSLFSVKGLRSACYLYRGDPEIRVSDKDLGQASLVHFDPPQEKVYEDHRGGSPWAAGYTLPPLPKDNKWRVFTSFGGPGTFVVRCQAHDGLLNSVEDITFEVTE
jgi:hypothetical protein